MHVSPLYLAADSLLTALSIESRTAVLWERLPKLKPILTPLLLKAEDTEAHEARDNVYKLLTEEEHQTIVTKHREILEAWWFTSIEEALIESKLSITDKSFVATALIGGQVIKQKGLSGLLGDLDIPNSNLGTYVFQWAAAGIIAPVGEDFTLTDSGHTKRKRFIRKLLNPSSPK